MIKDALKMTQERYLNFLRYGGVGLSMKVDDEPAVERGPVKPAPPPPPDPDPGPFPPVGTYEPGS